jgi:hypothetical protein
MNTVARFALVVVFTIAGAGCAIGSGYRVPLDPAANFAAHAEHRGIVVDRMADGQQAVLVPNGRLFTHRPPFLLEEDERDVAALRYDGARLVVNDDGGGQDTARVGEVDPSWSHGAIHLTFHPIGHEPLHTGAFHRVGWGSPELLGQQASNVLDMPGIYRAEVRDAQERPVGWMRVEIGRFGPVLRVYDGELPNSINGPLAVAGVEQIQSDIDWVEQHAINPYVGN